MVMEMTSSGLPALGAVPWGSHFCQFYRTADELADLLVPFFKAGLENNEQCIWVTCEPFDAAHAALSAALPDLDGRIDSGQIEILDFGAQYTRGEHHDIDAVLNDWIARKEQALARGYAGLRVCWIDPREEWRNFAEHEAKVNACLHGHRILALCSYPLDRCTGADAMEVIQSHHFAMLPQRGEWQVVGNVAKEELRKANEGLERRMAERTAQLRESERRFRDLLGALPAAVYTTDAAGRITYYNQAAADLAGRAPELGSDEWCVTWRLFSPDGAPMPHDQCPMAVALKENRPVRGAEAIAERPDGTRVPFIPYPTPLRDESGTLVGAVNMLVDITEHKAAEEALRKSEERLSAELAATRHLQGISAELIHEQGVEGLYDKLVEAAAVIMRSEYASMQMLYPERGSGGELRLLAFRGFNPRATKFWEWVRADSESTCGVALRTSQRVIAPDVEICDFMAGTEDLKTYLQTGIRAVQTTPLISRSGRLLGMISTHWREPHEPPETDLRRLDVLARQAADVIERTQAAETLRELNGKLERQVEERTRALRAEMAERQKTEATLHQAQRLDAVGQLTGGIAHDFNNLLTVIVGNLDLMHHLSSKTGKIPKATLRRLVDGMQRAASRGERLTKQLLAFSRRDSFQLQVLDLHSTLDAFAPLLRRAIGETIEMRLALGDERWFSRLDLTQFEAAILNLVINARDAMPKGGTLTIETNVIEIEAADARRDPGLAEGSYVVVSVTDTGTGMAPDVQKKVFEPFFTTKEIGKGSGLGLSQVYGFTKQSGGDVTIDSEIGRGTTITLYLPQSSEAPDPDADMQDSEARGGAETILIVEDDVDVQEATVDAIDSLGYPIVLARDGREALATLRSRNDIDLLFTDHVMPGGLSGVELAREARALRPELKVLLTSGYAKHTALNSRNAEGFPSIAKPYRRSELAESIRAALDHRSGNGTRTNGSAGVSGAGGSRIVQHAARTAAPIVDPGSNVTRLVSGE
jgi:PAS domain S-box-containing protein